MDTAKILTFSLYCLLGTLSEGFCQTDTAYCFYDKEWNQIADSSKAEYKRISYLNGMGYWKIVDYYKNGQIQMTGMCSDSELKVQNGPFEWFYPVGTLKTRTTYLNGRPTGESFDYYENGQLDTYRRYGNAGKIEDEKLYKEDGSESTMEKPEFPGGVDRMYEYLSKNTKYPKPLRKRGIGGKVLISFVVHTDGSLQDIDVFSSPDEDFSKEALKVVSFMPRWKPGSRDGKLVRVKYNLPISFSPY